MRTTLDIPEHLISALKEITGERSKTKIICMALEEYLRKRKIEKLISLSGKIRIDYDWKKMEELEIKEMKAHAKKGCHR